MIKCFSPSLCSSVTGTSAFQVQTSTNVGLNFGFASHCDHLTCTRYLSRTKNQDGHWVCWLMSLVGCVPWGIYTWYALG